MRAAAALLLGAWTATAGAQTLTPAERRGRTLFLRGTDASGGPVPATLNGAPAPTALACAGCHGRDGRGRPEGGLTPADVRWQTLARALAATGTRHQRPAYDRARLKRAVTMGLDPAGRSLDPLMPRYHLQRADADDLLAFLERLGSLDDPGLTADAFRVGVLVASGTGGADARARVVAWADGLAARGGLYARHPRLVFFASAAELAALDEEHEPFVLVGAPDAASFEAVAAWATQREVPWVVSRPSDALPPLDRWIVVLAPAPAGVAPAVAVLAPLERALERIGRDATREGLVEALAGKEEPGR
ncbi:MAG: c-type cytochrome [Vicinamibacteria bacterium]